MRLHQRRFADAVVADDADRFAFPELQRDAMQHRQFAIAGVQTGDVEDERRSASALRAACPRPISRPRRRAGSLISRGSPVDFPHPGIGEDFVDGPSRRIAP